MDQIFLSEATKNYLQKMLYDQSCNSTLYLFGRATLNILIWVCAWGTTWRVPTLKNAILIISTQRSRNNQDVIIEAETTNHESSSDLLAMEDNFSTDETSIF